MIFSPNFEYKNFLFFILIALQVCVFLFIFGPYKIFIYDLKMYLDTMDAPGYLDYDFKSLETIFNNPRSFGLPLILKVYKLFDIQFKYWSIFNYLIYIFCINFFYHSLTKKSLDKIFVFLFCLGLIFHLPLYNHLTYWGEILSISFILIGYSFFFLSFDKKKYLIISTVFLFISYQIRPSMLIFVTFPVFYSIFYNLFFYKKFKIINITLIFVIPFLIFCTLRYLVVNDFGLISMNYGLSGNAIIYLEKTDIKKLKEKNQILAKNFLERKKKLSYPCNLDDTEIKNSYFEKKYDKKFYGQNQCWSEYTMLTMLEVIKQKNNKQPFKDGDIRNFEPWSHVKTLTLFWAQNNSVEIDNVLKDFAFDVYLNSKKQVFLRFLSSPVYFLKLQRDRNINLVVIYILVLSILVVLIKKKKTIISNYFELTFLLYFIPITVLNLLVLYIHQNGEERASITQNFFFIPVTFSYLIYFILNNLKKIKKY